MSAEPETVTVAEIENQTAEERLVALEEALLLLRDEVAEWATYAARLTKRLDRLSSALVTTTPEAAHLLDTL